MMHIAKNSVKAEAPKWASLRKFWPSLQRAEAVQDDQTRNALKDITPESKTGFISMEVPKTKLASVAHKVVAMPGSDLIKPMATTGSMQFNFLKKDGGKCIQKEAEEAPEDPEEEKEKIFKREKVYNKLTDNEKGLFGNDEATFNGEFTAWKQDCIQAAYKRVPLRHDEDDIARFVGQWINDKTVNDKKMLETFLGKFKWIAYNPELRITTKQLVDGATDKVKNDQSIQEWYRDTEVGNMFEKAYKDIMENDPKEKQAFKNLVDVIYEEQYPFQSPLSRGNYRCRVMRPLTEKIYKAMKDENKFQIPKWTRKELEKSGTMFWMPTWMEFTESMVTTIFNAAWETQKWGYGKDKNEKEWERLNEGIKIDGLSQMKSEYEKSTNRSYLEGGKDPASFSHGALQYHVLQAMEYKILLDAAKNRTETPGGKINTQLVQEIGRDRSQWNSRERTKNIETLKRLIPIEQILALEFPEQSEFCWERHGKKCSRLDTLLELDIGKFNEELKKHAESGVKKVQDIFADA